MFGSFLAEFYGVLRRHWQVCIAIVLLYCCLGLVSSLQAQAPLSLQYSDKPLSDAWYFFQNARYPEALELFDQYPKQSTANEHQAQAHYGAILAASRLFHKDIADRIWHFEQQYPSHILLLWAYAEVGLWYYQQKQFDQAIVYLSSVENSALDKSKYYEVQFKLAYARFSQKQFEDAERGFTKVKLSNSSFKDAAAYYCAYLLYRKGNYAAALTDLASLERSETYGKQVPAMRMLIYYQQRDFDALILAAESVSSEAKKNEDIPLFLGDAYYYKGQFATALEYYKVVLDSRTITKGASLYYRIGHTAFQESSYEMAIASLSNIASPQDSLYGPAMFLLGYSYIRLQDMTRAYAPLRAASSARFSDDSQKIQAVLLFSKLLVSKESYKEAIAYLLQLEGYNLPAMPKQKRDELLSEAYLRTNEYQTAIAYLEKQPSMSSRLRKTYQEVCLLRGVELFNAEQYALAIPLLQKSLKYPEVPEIKADAYFFLGESFSQLGKYKEALEAYASLDNIPTAPGIDAHSKAWYGRGYASYKLKSYADAAVYFEQYIEAHKQRTGSGFYSDAFTRLADSYFILRRYEAAYAAYKTAYKECTSERDYIAFQTGAVAYALNLTDEASGYFNRVLKEYSGSVYVPDALYQLAQIQLENSQYGQAIMLYSDLIKRFPSHTLVPYVLNKRALSYQNQKQHTYASEDYKRVLSQYPDHDQSESALIGLQECFVAMNQPEVFQTFIQSYKIAVGNNPKLESIEYEAIKSTYLQDKFDKVAGAVDRFALSYPMSAHLTELLYYKAEALYKTSNYDQALIAFDTLLSTERNPYLSRSLIRTGDLLFASNRVTSALQRYQRLAKVAESQKDRIQAFFGLAECYLALNMADSALYAAEQILGTSTITSALMVKAALVAGKASLQKKAYKQASDYFLQVVNAASDQQAAEAQYWLCWIEFNNGNHDRSLTLLYEFPARYGKYEVWLGKAFLLVAENFLAQKEYLQARATLQSVIDRSPVSSIVEEARGRLLAIPAVEQEVGSE